MSGISSCYKLHYLHPTTCKGLVPTEQGQAAPHLEQCDPGKLLPRSCSKDAGTWLLPGLLEVTIVSSVQSVFQDVVQLQEKLGNVQMWTTEEPGSVLLQGGVYQLLVWAPMCVPKPFIFLKCPSVFALHPLILGGSVVGQPPSVLHKVGAL